MYSLCCFALVCPLLPYALRTSHEAVFQAPSTERCAYTAKPSNPDKFDVISLSFKDPDFTFFDSREFFLSPEPSCIEKLGNVKLRSVPNTTAGRLMQQERRFKVKQIKDTLNVLNKKDGALGQKLIEQLRSTSEAELPAVELHMFPDDPLNVDSVWHVLLIPKARELFHQPVYLCRATSASQSSVGASQSSDGNDEALPRCVSRLEFEELPWRLMNLVGAWDPALDTMRSVPHRWILALELLLLLSAWVLKCKVSLALFKLILLMLRKTPLTTDIALEEAQKFLNEPMPKSYKLSQHVEVYQSVDGDSLSPEVFLEAGDVVEVTEVKGTEGNRSGPLFGRWTNRVKNIISSTTPHAVWGHVQKPEGWILLYDSARDENAWKGVVDPSSRPIYRANPQLMPPLSALLRRQLVLAASHASVQWLLLERLAPHLPLGNFIAVAVSFFILHVFVLRQGEWTAKWGRRCDQALDQENKMRLEPPTGHATRNFIIILSLLLISLLVGSIIFFLSPSRAPVLTFLSPCALLLMAVSLHAWDLKSSMTGLTKWREPQLSGEYTEHMGEPLPKTSEPLPLDKTRERTCWIIDLFTWLMASAGLACLVFMGLDAFQMQGALVNYSFSKGHLTYVAGNTALHNTLLLHDATDSVVFFFKAGDHTENVTLTLEHPQLDDSINKTVPLPLSAGEYEISLPAGPLYGRIVVKAESRLQIRPTEYTFHVVRVGESLSLRLSGEVNSLEAASEQTPVNFLEKRRWLFQRQHPDWYVPDLKPDSNWTLQVQLHPVCYAPLRLAGAEPEKYHIVHHAENCQCGETKAGFGTECVKEEVIKVSGSTRCFFLRSVRDELPIPESKASLSTGLGTVSWLQDVYVSGKYAGLRLADRTGGGKQGSAQDWIFEPKTSGKFKISNLFEVSVPTNLLLQSTELDVATTQDETDAEEERLALRIVPHPPPVTLEIRPTLESSDAFLMPPFAVNNKRSEYVACVLPDLKSLYGLVPSDGRFDVEEEEVNLGTDCLGIQVSQKRFRAAPNFTCDYCNRYKPWNENFDVAVTRSAERCLLEAIDADQLEDLRRLKNWAHVNDESEKKCSVLQHAVRLERIEIIKELLTNWNVNCDGCTETPLGVAAAEGKMEALELLLKEPLLEIDGQDADGATALFRAAEHCHAAAAARLIERDSNVSHTMFKFRTSVCLMTPLLALSRREDLDTACSGQRLEKVLQVLRDAGAALSLPSIGECPEPTTALTEVIVRGNLRAVPVLLAVGADPNEPGHPGPGRQDHPMQKLLQMFIKDSIPWDSFTAAATALLDHGADIEVKNAKTSRTLLMEAAIHCQPRLVKFLVDKGANPSTKDSGGRVAMVFAEKSKGCRKNQTAQEEVKQHLQGDHA